MKFVPKKLKIRHHLNGTKQPGRIFIILSKGFCPWPWTSLLTATLNYAFEPIYYSEPDVLQTPKMIAVKI